MGDGDMGTQGDRAQGVQGKAGAGDTGCCASLARGQHKDGGPGFKDARGWGEELGVPGLGCPHPEGQEGAGLEG